MGTRNLTMVIANSETKVAQYGQWDGYPSGQGATALEFLRGCDLNLFKEKVSKLRWLTADENKQISEMQNWKQVHPYLSRDAGADILNAIYWGKLERHHGEVKVLGLNDQSKFAGDSLMCEYAYVIDLDKNTFEIYEGFNKTPLTEEDRFFNTPVDHDEYKQVKIVKTYQLDALPTEEQFLADLEPKEEEA